MQYIIFGAGSSGKKAALDLGLERVEFLASNNPLSSDGSIQWICYRKVISFEEMVNRSRTGDYMIVVASERYAIEMDKQLRDAGINKYFVYHEFDNAELWQLYPRYYLYRNVQVLSYTKVLNLYRISQYRKIAVYGGDFYLPYMISEISIQNNYNNIVGVIPHDDNAYGVRSVGIPVKTLDEVWDEIDCLVINVNWNKSDIRSLLDTREHKFDVVDIYDVDKFEPEFNHPDLAKYKDIHKGKRIFVIGNGPSLTTEDLNRLKKNGDICIASNFIYKIFPNTEWRPDYLCIVDPIVLSFSLDTINTYNGTVFISDLYQRFDVKLPDLVNIEKLHQTAEVVDMYYPNKPGFSSDLTNGLSCCFTVTYIAIQIAAYMGAAEIYLLGVDNTSASNPLNTKHFIDNYSEGSNSIGEIIFERDVEINDSRKIEMVSLSYVKAEEYSRAHNFRIFNATRGGKLEVFERVDFDSLFSE